MRKTDKELEDARLRMFATAEKYGDNRWWESDDPEHVAKYQLFEPILMTSFSLFHEGVEKMLDRPVFTHEFGMNLKELKEEMRIAIHRRECGSDYTTISDTQRDKKVAESIGGLVEFAERNDKEVIAVVVGGEQQ